MTVDRKPCSHSFFLACPQFGTNRSSVDPRNGALLYKVVGGPDLSQMEPSDELAEASRALQDCGIASLLNGNRPVGDLENSSNQDPPAVQRGYVVATGQPIARLTHTTRASIKPLIGRVRVLQS